MEHVERALGEVVVDGDEVLLGLLARELDGGGQQLLEQLVQPRLVRVRVRARARARARVRVRVRG